MSGASTYISQIKQLFQNEGIRSDIRIAEHVAALLLSRHNWRNWRERGYGLSNVNWQIQAEYEDNYPHTSIPALPPIQGWILDIIDLLENALNASDYIEDQWGDFFQRELRPELLRATSGVQYPTPHHIANFMANIGANKDTENVIDPTAGTGGLLAAAYQITSNAKFVGMDFDPQWAGMAFANLQLHSVEDFKITTEQSLRLYDKSDYKQQYNCVLMNPPFGGNRSSFESAEIEEGDFGRGSATLLGALALNLLKADGIAAFLQPSGTLFGRGGEERLRGVLKKDFHLESVITLPPEAMQPHSTVASHLIVARRSDPSDKTWFLQLTDDGYPAGASRDLTAEPNLTKSDLARARDLLVHNRDNQWKTQLSLENGQIQTILLGEDLRGLAVQFSSNNSDSVIWRVSYLGADDGVLVKVSDTSGLLAILISDFEGLNTTTLTVSDFSSVTWHNELKTSKWIKNISTDWQGINEDVTLTVDTNTKIITLSKGNTKYEFMSTKPKKSEVQVCLLNDVGIPISKWLYLSDKVDKRLKDIAKRNFSEIGATPVDDVNGEIVGWLIDFSNTNDEIDEHAILFITLKTEVSLLSLDSRDYMAFAGNGYLTIQGNTLTIQQGNAVKLRDDVTVHGFAIGSAAQDSSVHSLFGVLIHRDDFATDMRPSRFLPELETAPLEPPMKILANIRRGQTNLSSRVDTLLGVLGHPIARIEEANHAAEIPNWLTSMLNKKQRDLLSLIVDRNGNGKPTHFTSGDLIGWYKGEDGDTKGDFVQQHIELFLRMGLIQAVHTSDQNYYRLTTEGDVIKEQDAR